MNRSEKKQNGNIMMILINKMVKINTEVIEFIHFFQSFGINFLYWEYGQQRHRFYWKWPHTHTYLMIIIFLFSSSSAAAFSINEQQRKKREKKIFTLKKFVCWPAPSSSSSSLVFNIFFSRNWKKTDNNKLNVEDDQWINSITSCRLNRSKAKDKKRLMRKFFFFLSN